MTARLLMIALDGADGARLDRWSADGTLPALATLRRRGAARRLTGAPGESDDALWASFQYGVGVGEHGRFHSVQRLSDGRIGQPHVEEADRDAFWDRLSDAGARVAVLDAPKCRAPRPINGVHLADWLVHGRTFDPPVSFPPDLAAETIARFGAAPRSCCGYHRPRLSDAQRRATIEDLLASAGQKRAAALHHLAGERWDLCLVGFKEAHCAGHAFWDLADPAHAAYEAAAAARLGDPLLQVFRGLDEAVGALVGAAGADAEIVVFATTDMAPNGSLAAFLPRLIVRLNKRLDAGWASAVGPRSGWRCRMLPSSDNVGALRIEHDPRLGRARGASVAAAADALAQMLLELTDADSGRPVVAEVTRPSRDCAGAQARRLPDLLIHYAANAEPRTIGSSALGEIRADYRPIRPGNHVPGGFVIAAGPRSAQAVADVAGMKDFARLATQVLARQSASQSVGA